MTNGDFDNGPGSEWAEASSRGYDLVTTPPSAISAQSGSYIDWLGGAYNDNDSTKQVITVPAGTTSLVISGYYAINTEENSSSTIPYDHLYFDLDDSSSNLLERLAHYSNVDHVSSWTYFTVTASLPYAGQTLTFSVNSTNDNSGRTSFYVDTLSVKATHCP